VVCDLVADLLRHMEVKHATTVTPSLQPADAETERRPFCDPENFSSGYIMRSQDILFKQGSGEPWKYTSSAWQMTLSRYAAIQA
jgi:monooxygenase